MGYEFGAISNLFKELLRMRKNYRKKQGVGHLEASFSTKHKKDPFHFLVIGLRCSFFTLQTEASQRDGVAPSVVQQLQQEAGGDLFSVYIRHREAMVFPGQAKKEVPRVELNKPKSLLLPGTCLASVESLSMPLVHEVVLSADIRCAECQRRIADIMSRMNDTDSVLVNVLEKKVTLTCRYPGIVNLASRQVPVIYRNPVSTMAMIKRIFRSSRR
ncbi:PREDICTED: uncharacterized protein LOC18610507 isoform X1 [Theobroma cacao]|uniref:Uncharacterized protein LOC18610507 isoform X1 n=1 Tax=Theobroma cacao TaxID=3641 RepID=A0AB32VQJ2_THECC|nr:PREDICTED: uncharacterized protein LOC18610507 isoform X1 [Theobroma cacao]